MTDVSAGFQKPTATWGEYNREQFAIAQYLASKLQTITLVKVESCTNTGGVSAVGFVNVTPLVNQIDPNGKPIPHVTIYNVPYFRIQGGANAIIIDPQAGDIGFCGFASRDISKVKSTKAQANPGSMRSFSFADALYIGGMLNGAPTQYLQFSTSGIKLNSATKVEADVGSNSLVLDTTQFLATISGQTLKLDATGLYHNGVNIGATHAHSGVTTGPGVSGPPV